MRSFLGFIVFVTILVGVLALVVMPLVARPLIASLVRDALPFDGAALDVEVEVGPGLLGGTVDRLGLRGGPLSRDGMTIERLDVEVLRLSVLDRSFEALEGIAEAATLTLDDATTVAVSSVQLAGASGAVTATARLDAAATEALIRSKLAASGIVPDDVTLGAGEVVIEAGGVRVAAALDARDGALVLVPDQPLQRVVVMAPSANDSWRVTSASVAPDGLVLVVTVDTEGVLGG